MNYHEHIPEHAGADGTDITEFYREGETPDTAWPVVVVRKAHATRWLPAGWTVSCSDELGGYGARFDTKAGALAYTRKLVGWAENRRRR